MLRSLFQTMFFYSHYKILIGSQVGILNHTTKIDNQHIENIVRFGNSTHNHGYRRSL